MGMDPQAYQASLQAGNQGHWPSGGPQGGLQPPQAGAGGYPGSSVVFDPTTGMGFLPGGNSAEAPAPGRYGGYDEPGANRMGRGRDPGQMGMENAGAFGRADGSGMPRPQGGGGMGMGMGMGMGPGGGGMHQGRMGDMGMHGARGGPPRDMGMRNGPGGPMGMPSDGDRMHRPAPGMYGGGGMPNRGGGMGPGMGAGAMQVCWCVFVVRRYKLEDRYRVRTCIGPVAHLVARENVFVFSRPRDPAKHLIVRANNASRRA